jgi:tight adherence protein B
MELTPMILLAAVAGAAVAAGTAIMIAGATVGHDGAVDSAPIGRRGGLRMLRQAAHAPGSSRRQQRLRLGGWTVAGAAVWVLTGWPIAAVALLVVGVWSPWLLGSARVMHERIDRVEALATWCRRMADTLVGGGAIGLTQAITATAAHAPAEIRGPVQQLAKRIRAGHGSPLSAVREFADGMDDRIGDTVAAALGLALHQQSTGVARVLRQLADGVARDVRARREIEAERAEARQSIRMLLLIQGGVLALLALVPEFAAPYRDPLGQLVMAVLLTGTLALLVWMRRLALGTAAPRFLGTGR